MEVSAQLGFVEQAPSHRTGMKIHIFASYHFGVEMIGADENTLFNGFDRGAASVVADDAGLNPLSERLLKFLPIQQSKTSKQRQIHVTITQHDIEHGVSKRVVSCGYFHSLMLRKSPDGSVLSILIKLENQRCPIQLRPSMTIEMFKNAGNDQSNFLQDDADDNLKAYTRARRMSLLSMEGPLTQGLRQSTAKKRYYDIPSAMYPPGSILTDDDDEAQRFLESFSNRAANVKKNFFVRNHRELGAGVLLCAVAVILGISLHFGYFVKNADSDASSRIPSVASVASTPQCSINGPLSIAFTLQLHGVTASTFTEPMRKAIETAMNRVLGIDWQLCLDSVRDVPARRISLSIDVQLALRLIASTQELAQAVATSLRSADTRATLGDEIGTALAVYSNITVVRLVPDGPALPNATAPALAAQLTTPRTNASCGALPPPENATTFPAGPVQAMELVLVLCNAGYAPVGPGSLTARCLPDGTFSGPLRTCAPCAPGLFRPLRPQNSSLSPEDAACLPCLPGFYSPQPAAAACTRCPPEAYQNRSGATACAACAPFSRAPAAGSVDAAACRCTPGHVGPRGGPCVACAEGYVAPDADMMACVECERETRVVANGECVCRAGFFSRGGSVGVPCEPCPPGEVSWDPDRGFGTYGGAGCLTCPAIAAHLQYHAPDPVALPTCVCEAGYESAGGVVCTACPPGSLSVAGRPCSACPAGYVNTAAGSTACTPCPPGTRGEAGGTACAVCEAGSYSEGGSGTCAPCGDGRYSSSNASVCEACLPGTFAPSAGRCVVCVAGTYAPAGSAACADCAPGTYSLFQAAACGACPPAHYSPNPRSTTCARCPAGTFAPREAASACAVCAAGQYSLAASTACTVCAAGTYQASAGASACEQCPFATYQESASASECGSCPPGANTSGPGANAVEQCLCPRGLGPATTAGSCSPMWRRGVQLNLSVAELEEAGWRRCYAKAYLAVLPSMEPIRAACPTDGLLLFAATRSGAQQLAVAAMGTARGVYRYNALPVVNPLLQQAPPRPHNGVWWYQTRFAFGFSANPGIYDNSTGADITSRTCETRLGWWLSPLAGGFRAGCACSNGPQGLLCQGSLAGTGSDEWLQVVYFMRL